MLARLDAFRPHALLLTLPVTLLWTPQLGVGVGAVVVLAHATGLLFLSGVLTKRDLSEALDTRLGMARDRFSVDHDALDLVTGLLGVVTAALVVVLLIVSFAIGVYAVFVALSALWITTLPGKKRYVRMELIAPAALIVAPAMLLRADAWRGVDAGAISPAAHGAAWLIGALMLAHIVLLMTRDRAIDQAKGVTTTASAMTREGGVVYVGIVYAGASLLAALGAGAGWWGIAPVLLAGWTLCAVLVLLCLRWDSWAVGAGAVGGGLVAFTTAFGAI